MSPSPTADVAHVLSPMIEPPVMLVTGASGAIGFEIAARAAEAGWAVAAHGRAPASADDAMRRLRIRAPAAALLAAPGDLMQPGAAVTLVQTAVDWRGRLDALVHCAVSAPPDVTGPLRHTDPAQFASLAAHSLAPLQALCRAAETPLAARGGAAVAFTSDAGRFAAADQSLIAAGRAGIIGFCRSLALEWAREGARLNCISLSFVEETPVFERFVRQAGGRAEASRRKAGLGLPRPADIAPLALFLCGPGAAKITGQVVSINGGLNA